MKGTKAVLAALGALATLALAASPAAAQQQWNLASRLSERVFHEVNLRQFVAEVEQASGGEVKITVHSAGSLFKHPEIKRAVQQGLAEMGQLQLSSFANEDELFNFETIPFMATTYEEVKLLWQASKPHIEKRLARDSIRVLYASPWPPQAIYAKKKLGVVADLKGVKFRTYNRVGSRIAELMGAQPVLVIAEEVPQAFSTGMIEAMVTSSAFGASVKAWDFVKYYHNTQAWLGMDHCIVSERAFRRLSPKAQQAMLEAAARAEERAWKMSQEANETEKGNLVKNGMEIVEPSEAFMKEAKALSAKMIEEWVKAAGETARQIADDYEKLRGQKKS